MKRIQVFVNGKTLTYETNLKVRIGTKVIVPAPWWLNGVDGIKTLEGKVTNLTSDYTENCIQILSIKHRKRKA